MKVSYLSLSCCVFLASCGAVHHASRSGRPPVTLASIDSQANRDRGEGEAEESPADWADFYLLRRTGGGPLPVEKLLQAKLHKDRMPVRSIGSRHSAALRPDATQGADIGAWQPLGPGNIGGRTRALVISPRDPNTMYAGAEGGGAWKTADGGKTWNPLSDLLPSLAISTLAMDPNDPNTLYAGTGEWFTGNTRGNSIRGAGIFKTSDGGATWNQLPQPAGNAFDYVNKVVVSPGNSQHVYAADWAGIHFSADGGSTWRLQLNRSGILQGCQDLVIRTDQTTDYLFAACAAVGVPSPAIFRNTDAAGTGKWEIVFSVGSMTRTTLALAPSNQGLIYAAVSAVQPGNCPSDNSSPVACYNGGLLGVWRSTANGDAGSWTQQVSNQDPTFLNTLLFTNPRDASADVCSGGISKKTWVNQAGYDNLIAVDPSNPDVVWVGGVDLFRSDDGGHNWGIASFWELESGQPQGSHADHHLLVFSPAYNGADNQTLFDANDGGIYRTDNALASTATGDRAACPPYATSVAWQSINNGYAVTQFYHGSVYPGGKAYQGGSQDTNMERGSDATGPNAWSQPLHIGDGGFSAIDPTDPNIWYITGTRLNIQKTADGGGSFTSSITGITEPGGNFMFIAPLVMDPGNSKRLYFGGHTLWRTNDGAAHWSEAASPIPPEAGSISSIAVAAGDGNQVAFGTTNGQIFTSSTALTSDKTTVWNSTFPRLGFVSSIVFDPNQPATIYATYSEYNLFADQSHVYRSTDGGATWSGIDGSDNTGLPDVPVFSMAIDPQNSSTLYIGTDLGLFVSSDGGATWGRDSNPFADAVTETLVLDRSAGQTTLFAFTHGRGVWRTVLPGSGDPCRYSLSAKTLAFPAYGATASFDVTAADNCVWSVLQSGSVFFRLSTPATGLGNGTIRVTSRFLNNTTQPLTTQIVLEDQSISASQDPAQVASDNDEASSAFPLNTLPAVLIEDTSIATEAANDPVHSCTGSPDSKTLWFSITAPSAGRITLSMINLQPNGADAGTALSLYRNSTAANPLGSEFGCLVAPQTKSGSRTQTLSWTAVKGATYLVEVSATTSGASAGATLTGGNLSIWVSAPQ